jgi:hypothetical protein
VYLKQVVVRLVLRDQDHRFQDVMPRHHYLGALPKIGETLRYVACIDDQWVGLASFSAPALKCAARVQWIGWPFRHQFDRLNLLTNNSRFLILPDWHLPNLGTRILSLCRKRLPADWHAAFAHPLLLLETFVDPVRFNGTIYKADNWTHVGHSKGFHRHAKGYSDTADSPKMVFVKPLRPDARNLLSQPQMPPLYQTGGSKIMLQAEHMQSLPGFFAHIPDPRRPQGRRHRLATVLAIAAAATLCGMRGYQAIYDWANSLGQKARQRFQCRYRNGHYSVPSLSIIRDVLIRVDPVHLDEALQKWNRIHAGHDQCLAIDGKTMCNAIDDEGRQTHIMSVVGHTTATCYTQKKSVA